MSKYEEKNESKSNLNQEQRVDEGQESTTDNDSDQAEEKSNLKKWLIIGGAVLLFLAVIIYLIYTYLGILIVSVDQSGSDLYISDREYKKVGEKKIIIIKPGLYDLNIRKEGLKECDQTVNVQPLSINIKKVVLSRSYYVNNFFEDSELDIFSLAGANGKKLIYFSNQDKNFYHIQTNQKSYIIADRNVNKIKSKSINLKDKKVTEIKYSPSANQAFIITGWGSEKQIFWYDIKNNKTRSLDKQAVDVGWISDSKAAIVFKNGVTSLKTILVNNWDLKEIANLPSTTYSISCNDKYVSVSYRQDTDKLMRINLEKGIEKKIDIPKGLIVENRGYDDKFLVQIKTDEGNQPYLINDSGNLEKLDLPSPYLGNITWLNDDNLIYIIKDKDKKNYRLMKYNLSDQSEDKIDDISLNSNVLSNLTVADGKVYYLDNKSLMGVEIE